MLVGWTESRVIRLRYLREQGLSASQIGVELGVTRNAVIGKLHRLGLNAAESSEQREARRAAANARCAKYRASKGAKVRARIEVEAPQAPQSLELTLETIQSDQCRFIAGDPLAGGTYCGHPVAEDGLSWCQYHYGLVYEPTTPPIDERPFRR
jgi:GcrA cell cycle regulator